MGYFRWFDIQIFQFKSFDGIPFFLKLKAQWMTALGELHINLTTSKNLDDIDGFACGKK